MCKSCREIFARHVDNMINADPEKKWEPRNIIVKLWMTELRDKPEHCKTQEDKKFRYSVLTQYSNFGRATTKQLDQVKRICTQDDTLRNFIGATETTERINKEAKELIAEFKSNFLNENPDKVARIKKYMTDHNRWLMNHVQIMLDDAESFFEEDEPQLIYN